MSKDFSISKELPLVIFSSARCKENMQITSEKNLEMSGCRENSPRGVAQVRNNETFLIH